METGPIRSCAGCRKRRPQAGFIRVARLSDGTVTLDPPGSPRSEGRGAYICPEETCAAKALKHGLRRTLKIEGALPKGLKEALLGRIDARTARRAG